MMPMTYMMGTAAGEAVNGAGDCPMLGGWGMGGGWLWLGGFFWITGWVLGLAVLAALVRWLWKAGS